MLRKIAATLCVVIMLTTLLTGCTGVSPKEFTKAGMSITLDGSFVEKDIMSMTAYYESTTTIVTALKEDFSQFEDLGYSADDVSLMDYADLVIYNNGLTMDATEEDDLIYFTYDKTVSGKDASYVAYVFKGTDAFWLIQFGCEKKNIDKQMPDFKAWAKTVKFS